MVTTAKRADFVDSDPVWNTTLPKNGGVYEGMVLNGINSPIAETRHNSSAAGTTTAKAFGYDGNVKVEVVEKYKYDYKIVPGAISSVFDKLKDLDNKFGETVRKMGTVTGLKPSFKIDIAGTAQNNEVVRERFLQDEKQVGASAKFGLSSAKDNPIPVLNYRIPFVGEIGGYWRVNFEVSLAYNYLFITKNDPAKTKTERIEIPLKATGGLEIGAKVALLQGVDGIDISVKGYGKGAIYSQGRYTPSRQEFDYEIGFEAVVGGFSGTIKTGGYTVFDQKVEVLLLDKNKWYYKQGLKIDLP